jgi:group II intron reverse transcriptase/maturase
MKAVYRHVPEKWACMYIQRWLEMPILKKNGKLEEKQGKGTPQGGVISPLLANLFLHYAFDKWLERSATAVKYVRYADDAIIHCKGKAHADRVLKHLEARMTECGLELHPKKTKLVYCRDYKRQGKYKTVQFEFLGYSFQPRTTKSKRTGKLFLGYDCAISISSRKRLADKLEELDIINMSFKSIVGIAQKLNPYIRGWINYYGKFRGYELSKVFYLLRCRLIRWARKRYKRYKHSLIRACKWLERVRRQYPYLFYHWQLGFSN